jgi:hypothetical protein
MQNPGIIARKVFDFILFGSVYGSKNNGGEKLRAKD